MLYLEDYLEMIENLPMEMRDRFTEMREMDLQVQNAMDSLDDRVKQFFKKCHVDKTVKSDVRDEQFKKLKEEYNKALEDADEKVQLANQIYELLEKYLRKLDMEVGKFKLELEADNAGITEMLEKRSLELDKPPKDLNNHRPEKRKYSSVLSNHNHVESNMKRVQSEKVLTSLAHDAARETLSSIHKSHSNTSSPSGTMFNSSSNSSSAITYNLGHVGAGSNAAIAAAASQAIAATQQMQQGRRTSSLKASFEFTKANASDLARDLTFGAGFSSSPSTPTPSLLEGRTQRTKKQTARALAAAESKASHSTTPATSAPSTTPQVAPPTTPASATASPALADLAEGQLLTEDTSNSGDWQYDPNEPRYCICNQVSYGDMVGCDNDDCTIEWFHYPCVGLTQAPKGKWYCPQCTAAMKRRGRK